MRILVDGDSSGRRDLIVGLALEYSAELHWVNNVSQAPPQAVDGLMLSTYLADRDKESADVVLMNLAAKGDLVVTGDLGLAAVVIAKGAAALSPRGHWYRTDKLAEQLEFRHLGKERRRQGERAGGGPAPMRRADEIRFEEELRKALEGGE